MANEVGVLLADLLDQGELLNAQLRAWRDVRALQATARRNAQRGR